MTDAGEPYGRVYVLDCSQTRKQYVGQTTTPLKKRWNGHIKAANRAARTQPISHAIRKYGPDAFSMHELEQCADQNALNEAELRWAHSLGTFAPSGYNLRAGDGYGSTSPELRARMSAAMTPERRAALSELWSGRRLTEEAYANARAALLRPMTLIGPTGELTVIEDSVAFAAERALQYSLLRSVFVGGRISHRGWRLVPELAVVEVPLVTGPGAYECPACGREWSSPSMSRASQHVVSCVRLQRCRDAALSLGNISAEQYEKARHAQMTPRVQKRDRRSPNATKRRVSSALLRSPEGELICTDSEGSMQKFALAHGLHRTTLSNLVTGAKESYRGWTLVEARDAVGEALPSRPVSRTARKTDPAVPQGTR